MSKLTRNVFLPLILLGLIPFITYGKDTAQKSEKDLKTVWLDELDISKMVCELGTARANKSFNGNKLTIGGQEFERGVGFHAKSTLYIKLDGKCKKFSAIVGIDDEVKQSGTVIFNVIGDDEKILAQTQILGVNDEAKEIVADLTGVQQIRLQVDPTPDRNGYDHGDWAMAKFEYTEKAPATVDYPFGKAVILTPKPKRQPQINGAKLLGVKPNRPFLYRIPASGQRPVKFSVIDLPAGLNVDPKTGIITGAIKTPGEYNMKFVAENKFGKAIQDFKVVVGNTLALTPPMGWNSWNCFGCNVSDQQIRDSAKALVDSELINHGWNYINIDDCWHGSRDPVTGEITSNEKFPDMKALCDYVHSLGLKIGLYTDCGPKTCAGFEGSQGHEAQDIMTYAKWGFDYVKVDYCYCENINPIKTYKFYGDAIKQAPRDIIFSICEWGGAKPWFWGQELGGNCWRTTGDICDNWEVLLEIANIQEDLHYFSGPGHWNDPDMLVVGKLGWGKIRDNLLTPDEQYFHVTLWTMLNSPLLIGCDLTQIDDFTMSLLTNDEVLEVNQDPLGDQASIVFKDGDISVWAKDMLDGSKVVGLFNRNHKPQTITAKWEDLGISGSQKVRNLWSQKDLGSFNDKYGTTVPRHGAVMIRLWQDK